MLSGGRFLEKRIIILIAMIVMLFNIAGCNVKKENKPQEIETSNEYYTRSVMKAPVEERPSYISKSQLGGLYVVTGDEYKSKNIWYVDDSENWEKVYDLGELINLEECSRCDDLDELNYITYVSTKIYNICFLSSSLNVVITP